MKKKIYTCLSLLVLLPVLVLTTQCQYETAEIQNEASRSIDFAGNRFEEKIYSDVTIKDDFDGYSVLVVMDKNTGGVNKRHEKSFFGGIEIESIEDLTWFPEDVEINKLGINWEIWRQILWLKLPGDSKENVVKAIRHLEKIEGIKYAGPGYYEWPDTTEPNDPDYGSQWGLSGTHGIQAPAAWDITIGTSKVRVGIIDTGIAEHPDLIANLDSGKDFYNNNYVTDDDLIGHGTHVAGIVGAVGDNNVGVSGVCWNVILVPLQVSSPTGGLHVPAVTAAIQYATLYRIPVLNYSGGGSNDDIARKQAIEQYPGLFVCSAGNDNADNDNPSTPFYPANHPLNNLIAVGALASNGSRWINSNFGANKVDIFAPGSAIYSTVPGTYASWSGTSMAAPFVAGVAVLVKSLHPAMTGSGLRTAILGSADFRPELAGLCVNGARLNAYKAVNHIRIEGTIDIKFNGAGLYTTGGGGAVGQILLGKFHLFENNNYIIAERGKWINPIPYYISDDSYLVCGPVPAGISTYIAQSGLGYLRMGASFYAPCYGPSWNGTNLNYASLPLNIDVYSSVVAIYYNGLQYYPGEGLATTDKKRIYVSGNG